MQQRFLLQILLLAHHASGTTMPIIRSSRVLCGISCCGFQVAGLVWSWGLCVRFAGCCSILQTGIIAITPVCFFRQGIHPVVSSTVNSTVQISADQTELRGVSFIVSPSLTSLSLRTPAPVRISCDSCGALGSRERTALCKETAKWHKLGSNRAWKRVYS